VAKIAYVKAWGLWSHYETEFNFSPGLTVITGPNGNGKSTLIRIIRWVALGEPGGEDFIFKLTDEKTNEVIKQADEGRAEIGLDNGIVITKHRRKGKTTYTINTVAEPFEKAEVPQEVKDALGIAKYSFGDFETYLNFAFQMEAPFLLSEAPSTGAKVLGKLAGTETVDLAITEVSKRTHKAREEKRLADKEIARLNGDLLDYQDVDDLKAVIEACEYLIIEANSAAIRKDYLTSLVNNLECARDNIARLEEDLVALMVVPDLEIDLKDIEKSQQRYNGLLDLLGKLEDSNLSIVTLTEQLHSYINVDYAADALEDIERKSQNLSNIKELSTSYTQYMLTIAACEEALSSLREIGGAADSLIIYENQYINMDKLKQLHSEYTTAAMRATNLGYELQCYEEIGTADVLLGMSEVASARVTNLKTLQIDHTNKCIVLATSNTELKMAVFTLEQATEELAAAWEATGGICPLCEQETKHTH
jgi:exonuclease SbcC